ncbi:hypothetical protein [Crossiella cryophila]|uniref:Uncharacterized protein n=2 Tax=Crossiella cryophila TaxID=43355 RepID=A0A7W7C9U4_9PSEU|nr:hypothetical protein [Crossiella cryophila]MBB4677202.1 hypothetical protein [Crossiella cryophila]
MSAPTVGAIVDRAGLVRCVERDLRELAELDTVVHSVGNLVRQSREEPPRARSAIRTLWETATAARKRAAPNRLLLARVRSVLQDSHCTVSAATTAAVVHGILHGSIRPTALTPDSITQPPLRIPPSVGVRHGALADLLCTTDNLADSVWNHAHRSRIDFDEDLRRLRTWLAKVPELRAPDRLVPLLGESSGEFQVHRHPRPVHPRTAELETPSISYEVLTAAQLDLLHTAIRQGLPVKVASMMAGTTTEPLSAGAAVAAVMRCGAWLRRTIDENGLPVASSSYTSRRMSPSWLIAAPVKRHRSVRAFALHYTPELGRWYQILRGDIPDLRGLMPMRRAHYLALAAHVAGGGRLSDFAEHQARRYRDVVQAWDRMTTFTAELRLVRQAVLDAVADWPAEYTEEVKQPLAELVQTVRTGLAELGRPADQEIGAAYGRLINSDDVKEAGEAFGALTAVLTGYRNALRRFTVADPTDWGSAEFALFHKRYPDTAPSDFGTSSPRAHAVEVIRAEVRRLLAARLPAVPATEVALLAELHRELSNAVREQRSPGLASYWRLWLTPGAPDEHVWRAFLEWPDLVTLAATK